MDESTSRTVLNGFLGSTDIRNAPFQKLENSYDPRYSRSTGAQWPIILKDAFHEARV